MPVEFDPPAPVESSSPAAGKVPVESSDEVLAAPRGVRRSRVIAGTAVAVVVIAGAITVGLTESSASASPASLAAAASSSAPGATGSAPARPSGPAGRGAFQPGPPFIFGTVKSVSGTTIKVTDQQGFTRTVVTSSKTTYKGGATATPTVGAKIIATGTVDANGTSLDATTISALPAAGASGARPGGFGAPGGRGFGGPGGHGPGGPRPTGPATGDFHPGERGKPGPTSAAPTPAPTTPTPSK
jgi:hypothetical protein